MTVQDYEKSGGFTEELQLVRAIGQHITTLLDAIPARPHRSPEITAAVELRDSLDKLRLEICATRRG